LLHPKRATDFRRMLRGRWCEARRALQTVRSELLYQCGRRHIRRFRAINCQVAADRPSAAASGIHVWLLSWPNRCREKSIGSVPNKAPSTLAARAEESPETHA